MWANFHTHSQYCDGKGSLADYLVSARNLKAGAIGFSSHAPLPFDCRWCMKNESLPSYLKEIETLRQTYSDLEIYKSLEIDFIPGVVSPHTYKSQLDYTIGSIHFVDSYPDGRHWEIDGPHVSFLEGLTAIFKDDMREMVKRYFELTRQMIESACPDIVGHLDKIKIQNSGDKFFSETEVWYREEILKTLRLVKEAGAIIEVNTRGLYQKKSTTPYPSPWILEQIKTEGIPILLSSDAHHPDDLFNTFAATARLLNQLGFRQLATLTSQGWKNVDFNENGIAT